MGSGYGEIKHFTDIEAWKLGRDLRRRVYVLAKRLPPDERHGLSSQMRRAAVSITANLAEGYGRYHFQENIQFCRQSRGSLYEIQDHLITCLDAHYLEEPEYREFFELTEHTIKALNGYIRMLKRQQDTALREKGNGK